MLAEQVRLPDLWLKRDLAFQLLPVGSKADGGLSKAVAGCLSGWKAVRREDGTSGKASVVSESRLSRLVRGDAPIRVQDELFYLAATLEYLVLHGTNRLVRDGRALVEEYAVGRGMQLDLYPGPILGTFSDFARALLTLVSRRKDYEQLGGEAHFLAELGKAVRQQLHDSLPTMMDEIGNLHIISDENPENVFQPLGEKRVVRQWKPGPLNKGDYVQLVVPAERVAQTVFGFELRADDQAVTLPWIDAGSWFRPRAQAAFEPARLLTEYAKRECCPTIDCPGDFWIQVVGMPGVGVDQGELPSAIQGLTAGRPEAWPTGYAEAMAFVTYVKRQVEQRRMRVNTLAREELYLEPGPAQPKDELPAQPNFYRTRYSVV